MIKTDEVIYRTRTLEEYNWLMDKLEAAGCEWSSGLKMTKRNVFFEYSSDCCIRLRNEKMQYSAFDFYKNESDYKDYEFIEVSDLMGTEKEPDAIEELEAIHKQLTCQINDLRKQGKEPKAIEYTIKVCFE